MEQVNLDDYIIREEEKNSLRLTAIADEVNRLKTVLNRKNKTITFYKLVFWSLISLIFAIVILKFNAFGLKEDQTAGNQYDVVEKPDPIAKHDNLVSSVSTREPIETKYFTVFINQEDSYPLAQFEQRKQADEFCKLLVEMNLPKVKIIYDTKFETEPMPIEDSHNLYEIQIGAYSLDIFKEFENNLLSIKHKFDANMHKYSISPFYGYSKSLEFKQAYNLERSYITRLNR